MKKKRDNSFWSDFKQFISRGNVIDLAVGIIIGSAFTAIVTSLVGDIVTPLLGLVIGGIDFTALALTIPSFLVDGEGVTIAFGNFIQSVISFLAIAFCVFVMIRILTNFKERTRKKEEEKPKEKKEEPAPDPQLVLLEEIRDLLKNQQS